MGCDIHAMIEVQKPLYENSNTQVWINAGDPLIDRDYTLFSVIGNVRNYDNIPYIGEDRFSSFLNENSMYDNITPCEEFKALIENWDEDGHSHSYVTLKEMKDYDTNQRYNCSRIVLVNGEEEGAIIATCAYTNCKDKTSTVGTIPVFGEFPNGKQRWIKLIERIEKVGKIYDVTDPEKIRLVFFFDN